MNGQEKKVWDQKEGFDEGLVAKRKGWRQIGRVGGKEDGLVAKWNKTENTVSASKTTRTPTQIDVICNSLL